MRNKLISFLCDRFSWSPDVFTGDESDLFDIDGDYKLEFYTLFDDQFGLFGKFVDRNGLENLIKANGIDDLAVFRSVDFKQVKIELDIRIGS